MRKICNKYYVRVAADEDRRFNDFVDQHEQIGLELLSRDTANGKASMFYAITMDTETELAMKLACNVSSCLAFTRTLDKFVDKK